jgi:hypothetical protein
MDCKPIIINNTKKQVIENKTKQQKVCTANMSINYSNHIGCCF